MRCNILWTTSFMSPPFINRLNSVVGDVGDLTLAIYLTGVIALCAHDTIRSRRPL